MGYFIASPNKKSSEDLHMADIVAFEYLTKLCSECESICVLMTDAKDAITQSFLSLLSPIIERLNAETKVESIQLQNIRNQCSDKEMKKFKTYLHKHKIDWYVTIKSMDSDRYKDKFQYIFHKKDKYKKKKFFNMFGHK